MVSSVNIRLFGGINLNVMHVKLQRGVPYIFFSGKVHFDAVLYDHFE